MARVAEALTPDRSVRHLYGAEVRRLRGEAGMTLDALGDVVGYSKGQLSKIERAEVMIPPKLSEALDACFNTGGHFVRLYALAKREVHPDKYRRYMELEATARGIAEYAAHTVPGLLQTEAYARALLSCREEASPDEVEERIAARMSRQDVLRTDPQPHLWAIMDESVLRRAVGGPRVMHDQLAALLPLVDTSHSKIQILPFDHGAHALLGGTMILLTLPDGSDVAYEEAIASGTLHEGPESVSRFARAYDALRAYARTPRESETLIKAAMEE
ncbi:helix-turn-helix domain-containing protein [Streptomyces sp. NPDC002659]|uniref:helix-turn-helix domain-containing protein n=1 Tax=Streptomyces sp. NPDC002659 TaxID=3364656 RepID=UPI00368E8E96